MNAFAVDRQANEKTQRHIKHDVGQEIAGAGSVTPAPDQGQKRAFAGSGPDLSPGFPAFAPARLCLIFLQFCLGLRKFARPADASMRNTGRDKPKTSAPGR